MNPEDFSNRKVGGNNAAIICRQVRSPGLAEPDSPSGNSTGSSFRHSHKVSGGNTGLFVSFWYSVSVSRFKVVARCLIQMRRF